MGTTETYQQAKEEAIETERGFACSILVAPSEKEEVEEKPKISKETRKINIVEPQGINFTCWYSKKPGHTIGRCFALDENRQAWNTTGTFNRIRPFISAPPP